MGQYAGFEDHRPVQETGRPALQVDRRAEAAIHINCRSTVVASIRFSALLSRDGTCASLSDSGPQQVRADLSNYDWLTQQPAAFQDKAALRGQNCSAMVGLP
jgi:hypothetical protein